MLENEFSVVKEKYELAKVYAMTCDLDNLGKVNSEIDRFWKDRDMSDSELEYIDGCEKIIDKHVGGIIEGHLASLWEYAMDGDWRNMLVRGSGCLEYFNELKERDVLSNNVMSRARARLNEMSWVCKSSLYMSLLEDFNEACVREDRDVLNYLDKLKAWSGDSVIKGPCRKC